MARVVIGLGLAVVTLSCIAPTALAQDAPPGMDTEDELARAGHHAYRVARVTTGPADDADAKPARRRLRVLIDASKGGGVWWSPQSPPQLRPEQEHQGSKLAAYLRGRGWPVLELPRGMGDMTAGLARADVAVRIGNSRPHTRREVQAYGAFIHRGGALLILAGVRPELKPDPLAQALGLRFEKVTRGEVIDRWADHPATRELEPLPFRTGSVVTKWPESATPLAWLGEQPGSPTSGALVMGTLRFGKGTVVFLSSELLLLEVPQPFTDKLFSFLGSS